MYTDDKGIAYIEGSDDYSPLPALINPLMASVSNTFDTTGHRLTDGEHDLTISDDGAPRLSANPELVFDRTYNLPPNLYITQYGTFGRSTIPMPRIVGGRVSIETPTSGSVVFVTVTFPTGVLSAPPDVTLVSPHTTVPGNPVLGVGTSTVTETSMRIYLRRTSTATTVVNWLAVQL